MPRVENGYGSSDSLPLSGSSGSTFEMATLHGEDDDSNDDDTDSTDGHDGNRALLGSGQIPLRQSQFKAVKRASTWLFVRGILVETAPTLLLTIVGLTFTGELLEQVADWRAMQEVDELFILIPMLNNLKGNLEMNLSSRLSTAADLGELDILPTRKALVYGSLSLLQVQALLVSAVAAVLSFSLGAIIDPAAQSDKSRRRRRPPLRRPPANPNKTPSGIREFVMILCTAMASASLSGMILGSFMCSLIILCRRLRRNPDNIAPPLASCLGDLLTLCILGLVSSVLIRIIKTAFPVIIVSLLFASAVAAIWYTLRNEYVRHLIVSGWSPLFAAMVISSGTGLILDHFVNRYEGFGLLAVAIAGLPDAVGSIFVSRLSTSLHASAIHPMQSTHDPRTLISIMTLFLVTLPVQLVYVTFLHASGWLTLPWLFIVIFVFFFSCAVLTSLTSARLLTHFLWRHGFDPDTYAMPIQSSLVDLSGQLMLVACYEVAQALGADVRIRHTQ